MIKKAGVWNKLPQRGQRAVAGVTLVVATNNQAEPSLPLASPAGGTQQEPVDEEKKAERRVPTSVSQSGLPGRS